MTESTVTPTDIQQEVERNYRWNFLVNALDGASFWFGMSFISSTVILPLYVSHFTNNPLLYRPDPVPLHGGLPAAAVVYGQLGGTRPPEESFSR